MSSTSRRLQWFWLINCSAGPGPAAVIETQPESNRVYLRYINKLLHQRLAVKELGLQFYTLVRINQKVKLFLSFHLKVICLLTGKVNQPIRRLSKVEMIL